MAEEWKIAGSYIAGSYTDSVNRQYILAVVRQAHHEWEKCSALAVRPEPVEGCKCEVFKQNWYYIAGSY